MKNQLYIFYIGFALLFFYGCNHVEKISEETSMNTVEVTTDFTKEELPPSEYHNWFSKEGEHLKKTMVNEKLKMELVYLTPEYSALIGMQGENPANQQQWDTMVNNYAGITQLKLMISSPVFNGEFIKQDKPEPTVYEERIKYYSFGMQQDIFAINDKSDTIPCSIYHFERAYGVSPICTFLIGFNKLDKNEDLKIIIKEKVFSEQQLEFNFSSNEIKNVPQLKMF